MGWRTQHAYDQARREEYRAWRKSLTWREAAAWEWHRHKHFLAGAVVAGGAFWLITKVL